MSESTAVAIVQTPSVADYVAALRAPLALKNQQALAAAYDEACAGLIGPNDIQMDKGRSFKKKSAWRKLARHFGISVSADLASMRVEHTADGFCAYAVATASAPWGQSWTDVGACASDEATGKRVITIADAVATAMTRASNRAVSNLIAMGEVSAEEIGQRQASSGSRSARPVNKAPEDKIFKGKRLGDRETDDLKELKAWAIGKNDAKLSDLVEAINSVLTNRALAEKDEKHAEARNDDNGYEEEVSILDEDGDLPF